MIINAEPVKWADTVDLESYDPHAVKQLYNLLRACFLSPTNAGDRVHGVMVTGPRGSGKSTVVRNVAHGLGIPLVHFSALDAVNVEADILLRRQMRLHLHSIIVVDHADLVLNSRMEASLKLQLVATLRARRDAFQGMIMLISSAPDEIDPEVRSCIRHWIRFEIPSATRQEKIWAQHVSPQWAAVLCKASYGFVGADVKSAMVAQQMKEAALGRELTLDERCEITRQTTPEVFSSASNSAVTVEVISPRDIKVGFEDIGGLNNVKQVMREAVVWPVKYGQALASLGVRAPRGILLHGLPGTGKTMLASAVAKEAEMSFLSFTVSDLLHGFVGESEKTLSAVFTIARQIAPCILFFDEFQAIFGRRENVGAVGKKLVSQLLLEMDAIDRANLDVILIGATNLIQSIDPALLRFGRFDKRIHVPLPDDAARLHILQRCAERLVHWDQSIDLHHLVQITHGFSGAELQSLCNQAGLEAFQASHEAGNEQFQTITQELVLGAVQATRINK